MGVLCSCMSGCTAGAVCSGCRSAASRFALPLCPAAGAVLLELCTAVDSATLAGLVEGASAPLAPWLTAAAADSSPEALLLALRLWPRLPAAAVAACPLLPGGFKAKQLPAAMWSEPSVAAGSKAVAAAAAAFFTKQHLAALLPVLRATTASHPRLHSVWPTLLALLIPGFSADKVRSLVLRLGRLGGVRRIRLFAASESAAAVACVAFAPAAALAHRLPCRLLLCSSGIFFNPSTCRSSATPALRRPHARQLRRWRHSGPQWSTVTWYVSALAMALPACRDCSLRAAQQHASTTWFSCHLPVSLQFSGTFVRLESKLTGRSSPSQMLLPLRWPPPTSASTWPSRSSSCCCRTWGEACAVRPAAGAPVRRPASFAG